MSSRKWLRRIHDFIFPDIIGISIETSSADFTGVVIPSCTIMEDLGWDGGISAACTNTISCRFNSNYLVGSTFVFSNLIDTQFKNCNLTNVKFHGIIGELPPGVDEINLEIDPDKVVKPPAWHPK